MTAEQAAGERFYLDTSAQIERYCGTRRRQLKALLHEGGHATSTQVRREWNLYVLESCAAILNALQTARDRMDLVTQLNRGFGRTPSRHWAVTEWIVANETDLRVIELRARDYLRIRAGAAFEHGISTVRDGTACGVARRTATRSGKSGKLEYDFRCKKSDDICDQPTFLRSQLGRAQSAAQALSKSSRKLDAEMGQVASKLLSGEPGRECKGKACWGSGGLGGDLCIALECATDETLLTTDASFDLICPAIGVRHRRLT